MSRDFLLFRNVTFNYHSGGDPLFEGLDAAFPTGWTGIVGANGTGKTTLLKLAAGILRPSGGSIRRPGTVGLCEQRTDSAPDGLDDILRLPDGHAAELCGRLALGEDWPARWRTLSHGERKRAQIAVALYREDPVVCLDEPTNHVDGGVRTLLAGALARYRGIGLLVSHDRGLLDELCARCLFLDPPRAVLRPGGWSQGREQQRREEQSVRRRAALARADVRRVAESVTEARLEAARSRRRLSKRGIARHDTDSKGRIDLARFTGKDAVPGRLVRRLESSLERAARKAADLQPARARELGLWFASEPSRRDALLDLPGGYLPLGGPAGLTYPDLGIRPRDRVALAGSNGCGKSSLIAHLVEALRLEPGRLLFMPQEIDRAGSLEAFTRLRALPDRELGRAMTVIDLLGTDPKRLLVTGEPSPGEVRKITIAMGIARVPHLIVLDEPTNHLDLPSIECLETALGECSCALLLVSHDEHFLGRLTDVRWQIGPGACQNERLLRVVLSEIAHRD